MAAAAAAGPAAAAARLFAAYHSDGDGSMTLAEFECLMYDLVCVATDQRALSITSSAASAAQVCSRSPIRPLSTHLTAASVTADRAASWSHWADVQSEQSTRTTA